MHYRKSSLGEKKAASDSEAAFLSNLSVLHMKTKTFTAKSFAGYALNVFFSSVLLSILTADPAQLNPDTFLF